MLSLRKKMSLGFGGLLLIVFVIGVYGITEVDELDSSINVMLRENYQSVIACAQMKDAIQRMDQAAQFILLNRHRDALQQLNGSQTDFANALEIELHNITVSGEGEKAELIKTLYSRYLIKLTAFQEKNKTILRDRESYFTELLPLYRQIIGTADAIVKLNQQNMLDQKERARQKAQKAHRRMYLLLFAATALAAAYIFFIGRWILHPIRHLTESVEEIKHGNLDLILTSKSNDEIGRLSVAVNEMAASLRDFRRSGRAELFRSQNAAQETFNSLPDAIAVVDLKGNIDLTTEPARRIFGLQRNASIHDLNLPWAVELWNRVLNSSRAEHAKDQKTIVQHFEEGQELFFQPEAVPILDAMEQLTGIILIMKDVTHHREEDLQKGIISTVSHQLNTPLTSIRMAVHLLLEEKVGPLTEKQAELLIAAREDSDRLNHILEDLLDISRIESGRIKMNFSAIPASTIISESLEAFRIEARDRGIDFEVDALNDLPTVWADSSRIRHVFGNLISNAFRYTGPGGRVTLAARVQDNTVSFSVMDTGRGIPAQYLSRIFEQFFRVPEEGKESGAGLGLAIVKEIVEAHGGTVQVESREGFGSTFSFTLIRGDRAIPEETA